MSLSMRRCFGNGPYGLFLLLVLLAPALGAPAGAPSFAGSRSGSAVPQSAIRNRGTRASGSSAIAGGGAREPDTVLVAFRPQVSVAARVNTLGRLGLMVADASSPHFVKLRLAPAALTRGATVESTLAALRRDPAVRVAEPDYIVQGAFIPNDPMFPQLWGLHNTGQDGGSPDADIDAPEAWDRPLLGAGVIVAVLDTGVDYTHPELAEKIVRDGAGQVVGYDFYNDDPDPMDDHGHGTHISGTIAARGHNSVGVVGVCPSAKIMPVKWLRFDNRGRTSDEIRSIDFAREHGAHIMNISAGSADYSQLTIEALQRARDAGILVVAAAMNNAQDNDQVPVYPAGYNSECENILAVAASDRMDNLASFSNYGAQSVDIAAPGKAILSTLPGNTYQAWEGTSMAAPHVAGAAALLLSADRSLPLLELKARLLESVDHPPGLAGRVRTGRLNLGRAMGDGWEPDDSAREASEVRAGEAGEHTFHVPGDADWVRFTVPAGARVTMATSGLIGETDSVIGLIDTDGATILASDDDGGGGRASRIEHTFERAGTYFLAIAEYGGRGGEGIGYTVTVDWSAGAPPDAWEPDDTPAQARPVAAGQVSSHTFPVAGDVDWVKFTARKNRRVSLATSGLTGDTDTMIELYAADGSLLASDDDGGGGRASRLTVRFRRAGTYYLKVREYDGAGGSGFGYQLTVR